MLNMINGPKRLKDHVHVHASAHCLRKNHCKVKYIGIGIGIESLPHKKNRKTHKKKLHKNPMTKPHKFEVNST
jgi:hypothetical protein